MNIWLVSIFEQTPIDHVFSTRFICIAEEALSRGHKITFWGSTFKHNTKEQRFESTTAVKQHDNYKLIFVKSKAYEKNISFRRLHSHALLAKEMVKEFNQQKEKPDILLMAFPPISLTNEVSKWTSANNIPLCLDIIDPWPDLFEKVIPSWASILSKLIFYVPKKKVRNAFSKVDVITAISNQYLDWSEKYHKVPQKECLYPAADFEAIRDYINKAEPINARKYKLDIIYAGSLASSYDIPTLLKAAKILQEEDIHFYIAGAGPQEEMIQNYIRNASNVSYLGRLSKEELMRYYAHCDLGMTQHIKGATQSVTYKLFDLLAAGLPILNSLESEMCTIILNNRVGLHNPPGNVSVLVENIRLYLSNPIKLKEDKENGFKLAKEVGDTAVIYRRFVNLLEETSRKGNKF